MRSKGLSYLVKATFRRKMAKLTGTLIFVTAVLSTPIWAAGQSRPDLVVTDLVLGRRENEVAKVSVTVSNHCTGTESAASFVLLTFKESEASGSKTVYFAGSKVKPLKGGERQILTFDLLGSGKRIEADRHVRAEIDPYNATVEVNEGNNWRTLNPTAAGEVGRCR
jgi:CARDB